METTENNPGVNTKILQYAHNKHRLHIIWVCNHAESDIMWLQSEVKGGICVIVPHSQ